MKIPVECKEISIKLREKDLLKKNVF